MFAVISVLFAVASVFAVSANHDTAFCLVVTDQTLCNYTFGCYWKAIESKCTEQEHYLDGSGTCALAGYTSPDPYGYDCYEDGTNFYIYDPTYYDSCSADDYITGTCPTTSSGSVVCTFLLVNATDTVGSCYECPAGSTDPVCTGCVDDYATGCVCANDPWATANSGLLCYPNTANAGICEGRNTYACSAIPFCHWNSSKCQPDWKCYYSFLNGIAPNNVGGNRVCNSTSEDAGGSNCKSETIDTILYCTSDLITTTDETCLKASADQATCEAAGCEWIPPGTGTRPYNGWCVEIGSGASIARLSSIGLIVLLSIMLTFL